MSAQCHACRQWFHPFLESRAEQVPLTYSCTARALLYSRCVLLSICASHVGDCAVCRCAEALPGARALLLGPLVRASPPRPSRSLPSGRCVDMPFETLILVSHHMPLGSRACTLTLVCPLAIVAAPIPDTGSLPKQADTVMEHFHGPRLALSCCALRGIQQSPPL
jgi:hypothetical protein